MDPVRLQQFIDRLWDDSILPRLLEYIRIPNKSPLFDPQWQEHGFMDQAISLAEAWCRDQGVVGMAMEVVRLAGRTPVLDLDIAGSTEGSVLLYGHLDKQPEMSGWREGLGPWQPVLEGDRLYGRGGADDGYAVFASVAAVLALQAQGIPHPRCVAIIECCEESDRRRGRDDTPEGAPRGESALRRKRALRAGAGGERLACASTERATCHRHRGRLAGLLRPGGGVYRRGRIDPLHGHARKRIPGRPVHPVFLDGLPVRGILVFEYAWGLDPPI